MYLPFKFLTEALKKTFESTIFISNFNKYKTELVIYYCLFYFVLFHLIFTYTFFSIVCKYIFSSCLLIHLPQYNTDEHSQN